MFRDFFFPAVVALVGVAGRNSLSIQFMKTNLNLLQTRIFCALALGIGSSFGLAAATEDSADTVVRGHRSGGSALTPDLSGPEAIQGPQFGSFFEFE